MPPVPPRLEFVSSRSSAREAKRRRRRHQWQAAVAVVFLAAVAVIVVELVHRHDSTDSVSASAPASSRNAAATGPSESGSASGSRSGASPQATADPLSTRAMTRLVSARDGKITAAVEDLRTGREWVLHPGQRHQTASIVKADILETLLYQAQKADTPLSESVSDTAQGMIEASDNDDATDLFDDIGGPSGLAAYNTIAGLKQTTPSDAWGETLTSASDQIRLLRQLALPHGVLSRASIDYQLDLMHQIDAGENWGVTGGVPATGVKVALKNGWVPLTSDTDWEVNSIGWVNGDNHDYLIAVLTAHDPSETYGIDTIDAMSKLIYDGLGPVPPKGTRTISS